MIEQLTIRLIGEPGEPLLVCNGELSNPQYEWAKAMKVLTGKRTKTDADYEEIARLEWRGGLYYDAEAGPYMPGMNIRRSLIDAARFTKEGKKIERGVLRWSRINPLEYEGPRDPEAMWKDGRFRHSAQAVVSGRKVTRTRCQFFNWSTECTIDFDSSQVNGSDLVKFSQTAGQFVGLGAAALYFGGRFTAELVG